MVKNLRTDISTLVDYDHAVAQVEALANVFEDLVINRIKQSCDINDEQTRMSYDYGQMFFSQIKQNYAIKPIEKMAFKFKVIEKKAIDNFKNRKSVITGSLFGNYMDSNIDGKHTLIVIRQKNNPFFIEAYVDGKYDQKMTQQFIDHPVKSLYDETFIMSGPDRVNLP